MSTDPKNGAPSAKVKGNSGKRLTKSQWGEAEALWKTGDFSLAQLGEKFKISRESLSRHFTAKGITKGEKTIEDNVRARLEQAAAEDHSVVLNRIRETKEESYTWFRALGRMSVNEIIAAKQNGIPLGNSLNAIRAIEAAQRVVTMAWEGRASVLGLDKDSALDEELPELIVRGMTPEEVMALRTAKKRDEEMEDEAINEIAGSEDDLTEGYDDLEGSEESEVE